MTDREKLDEIRRTVDNAPAYELGATKFDDARDMSEALDLIMAILDREADE